MITVEQYFRDMPHTEEQKAIAQSMLDKVNKLLERALVDGVLLHTSPATGCLISALHGGFRLPDCCVGAKKSNHKLAHAVDIYDPDDKLDDWLYHHTAVMIEIGLFSEAKGSTIGWAHLQDVPPASGNRIFYP